MPINPKFDPRWKDLPPELQAALSINAVCNALFDSFQSPPKEPANAPANPPVHLRDVSKRVQ